ncbi:uncharacterized protein LOC110028179 [Phalaenopsis equestris]|uniref:uncharacterized protein LOC110028179 n=1 Tax=Phalaenopsis equestris TaxID=78828 RepID=UPI0009E2BC61|nr:uncharacterized protein LOC110028179 [Phalaenopsis equestris]
MGNTLVSPCFASTTHPTTTTTPAGATKLVFWGGTTTITTTKLLAGELLFQFPDSLICHANSFFIGQPVPALTIEEELISGETYFVLPADHLPCGLLTAASLALLCSTKGRQPGFVHGKCPFECVKGSDGKAHIRVLPEFIEGMISGGCDGGGSVGGSDVGDGDEVCDVICSTPELRKQYEQLVGSKSRPWSPRLETIIESNFKVKMSPCRFLSCDRV